MHGFASLHWSESYRVGNDFVDTEHQQLFSLLKDLINDQGLDNPGMLAPLKNFIESVEAHFHRKEEVMLQHNFSGYERHHQKHRHLIAQAERSLAK